MNKSIDSDDETRRFQDPSDDGSKLPLIASVKQVKGQEPLIQLWNLRTGDLIKGIQTDHKDIVNAVTKTHDYRIVSIGKDGKINLYY